MRSTIKTNFPCPYVSHIAVMRILIRHASHDSVMFDLGLERLDESLNNLIGIRIARQRNPNRQSQVDPKREHTRALINCSTCRLEEPFKILLNERPLVSLDRYSTIATVMMHDQVSILRMTNHVPILQCLFSYLHHTEYFLTTRYLSGI